MTIEATCCLQFILDWFARDGVEVTVSTRPPLVASPYSAQGRQVCPHGVVWWCEPTKGQIAQWTKDGTP